MLGTVAAFLAYTAALVIVFACVYAALDVTEPRTLVSYSVVTAGFVAALVVTTGLL